MARRRSFDFPYTCPLIDKEIQICKRIIRDYLIDYIDRLCSDMPRDEMIRISDDWSEELYKAISSCFEIVRETNEKIRDEAEKQIDSLECEIATLEEEIKSLQSQLDVVS